MKLLHTIVGIPRFAMKHKTIANAHALISMLFALVTIRPESIGAWGLTVAASATLWMITQWLLLLRHTQYMENAEKARFDSIRILDEHENEASLKGDVYWRLRCDALLDPAIHVAQLYAIGKAIGKYAINCWSHLPSTLLTFFVFCSALATDALSLFITHVSTGNVEILRNAALLIVAIYSLLTCISLVLNFSHIQNSIPNMLNVGHTRRCAEYIGFHFAKSLKFIMLTPKHI